MVSQSKGQNLILVSKKEGWKVSSMREMQVSTEEFKKVSMCEGFLFPRAEIVISHAQRELEMYQKKTSSSSSMSFLNSMMAPITHGIAPPLDHNLRRPSKG
jgi:hypothetical protein